ncbi:amidase family protein [Lentiprolixibacter aurantiacus]|uniref:Amidase family protein n=1 Tax=Lentiprolixibacter aurantiacus TaxID=2993939 RepID=A0AAE3MLQ1_9FLAO|nr:amidase family protein [Lentiprolixibacter aurantiacus]MCX2720145.1 amidase family protein [Lentiprolixibacter aurantiacus]
MKKLYFILLVLVGIACKNDPNVNYEDVVLWEPYNDSAEVAANQDHENTRMRYKLIQSRVLDKNEVFRPLYKEVSRFSEAEYDSLKPLILEQDIPTIQLHVASGELSYEKLVLFYLYRIYKYELDNATTLNTVIALNADVVEEAREKDREIEENPDLLQNPLFGMPVLLKDNINTKGMRTTAGAIALENNENTEDAFIVSRLKSNGALILGKVNLSEWAYFFCGGCPVGYSAIGGQTLNPYGRRVFETGGSSSGSGTSVAANYAVAAIGTETSGSILSPSGQNSVVGLKPTIGLLSRTGIVPISSTLDTPGPMTRNVVDNAILLGALTGKDPADAKSVDVNMDYLSGILEGSVLRGKRLGVFAPLMESDSVYASTVEKLKEMGAEVFSFTPPEVQMNGFSTLLNIDMKYDLPAYISTQVKDTQAVKVRNVLDVVAFNKKDTLLRMPYGQARLEGILSDSTTLEELEVIKLNLEKNGRLFFDQAMEEFQLDAVLSINNYHAGYAAVAKYPALTVPMGYRETGEPVSLTFIAKPFEEDKLLQLGYAFEQATKARKAPEMYNE